LNQFQPGSPVACFLERSGSIPSGRCRALTSNSPRNGSVVGSNRLLVEEAERTSISVRHRGNIFQDVVHGSFRLRENAAKALGMVQRGAVATD
jgi:hypothetical protein